MLIKFLALIHFSNISTVFQVPGMKHDYRQFRHINCNTFLNTK